MSGNIKSPLDGTKIQLASDVYIGMGQSTIIPEILENDRVATNPIRPQPPYKSGEWADVISNQPPLVRIPEIVIDRAIPMNGNTIVDLKTATNASEAVRYDQLTGLVGSGGTITNVTINNSTVNNTIISGGSIGGGTVINVGSLPVHDNAYHYPFTVDQSSPGGATPYGFGTNPSEQAGQTFTPAATQHITHFEFDITVSGTPTDNIEAVLYATSGGVPTGSPRAVSASIPARDIPTPAGIVGFFFPINATTSNTGTWLIAGTQYAVILRRTGSLSDTDYYTINTGTNPYSSGTLVYLDNGAWTSVAGSDATFYQYYGMSTPGGMILDDLQVGNGQIPVNNLGTGTLATTTVLQGNITGLPAVWTTTPAFGAITATTVNNVTITAPLSPSTLTIEAGGSFIVTGGYAVTLTATNTTSITLPTSGTLATTANISDHSALSVGANVIVGSNNTTDATLAWGYNYTYWAKFTAFSSGTLTGIRLYNRTASPGNAKVAIYSDNGSGTAPNARLAKQDTGAACGAGQWTTISLESGVAITSGTIYWLAFITDDVFVNSPSGTGGTVRYVENSYTGYTFPDTANDSAGSSAKVSIAGLTTASGVHGLGTMSGQNALSVSILGGTAEFLTITNSTISGYQISDAGLTSIAGLTYSADSFIKCTATDTYSLRAIADVKTDLSLNNVENTALSTWSGTTNIVTIGAVTATSINKVTITTPATSATLTLVTGSSLITSGAYSLTLTTTDTTNATFPTGNFTICKDIGSSNIVTTGTMTSGKISTGYVIGGVTMTLGSDATNDMYYRNSSGVLTRFASGNNSVVVTNGSGVPSISTTLPSGLAATNLILTTPALGTPSAGVLTNCTGLPSYTGLSATGGLDANTVVLLHLDGLNGATTSYEETTGKTTAMVGTATISNVSSKWGTSLVVDGNSDCLTIADDASYDWGTGDFTVECWCNSDVAISATMRRVLARGDVDTNNGDWCLGIGNAAGADRFNFAGRSGGATTDVWSSSITFNSGTWYHVALVRVSGVLSFYLNGVAKGYYTNGNYSGTTTCASLMYVGARKNSTGYTEYWDGYIDEVRMSNVARYTGNFTPPTRPFDWL